MPRYEHQCLVEKCCFEFEITYSIHEDPLIKCPKCQAHTKRLIGKNVMFETPVDVEWEKDPKDLTEKSFSQFNKAKKVKYRW